MIYRVIISILIIINLGCSKPLNQSLTHLIVYGDSISYGLDTDVHPVYVEIIADYYGWNLEQKSVGGTDMSNVNQYTVIMTDTWKPNTVIMYAPGVNDAILHGDSPEYLQYYHDMLRSILNKIHSNNIKAYIGTPIRNLDESRFVANSIIEKYAQINRDLVSNLNDPNIQLVDYNVGYSPASSIDIDGLHPNKLGYQAMSDYFFSVQYSLNH